MKKLITMKKYYSTILSAARSIGVVVLLSGCANTNLRDIAYSSPQSLDQASNAASADNEAKTPLYWRMGSSADLAERSDAQLEMARQFLESSSVEKSGFALYAYLLIPYKTPDPDGKVKSAICAYYGQIRNIKDKIIEKNKDKFRYYGAFYAPVTEDIRNDSAGTHIYDKYDYARASRLLVDLNNNMKIERKHGKANPEIYIVSYHYPLFEALNRGKINSLDKESISAIRIDNLSREEIKNVIILARYFYSPIGKKEWKPEIGYPNILVAWRTIMTNFAKAGRATYEGLSDQLRMGSAEAKSNQSAVTSDCSQ